MAKLYNLFISISCLGQSCRLNSLPVAPEGASHRQLGLRVVLIVSHLASLLSLVVTEDHAGWFLVHAGLTKSLKDSDYCLGLSGLCCLASFASPFAPSKSFGWGHRLARSLRRLRCLCLILALVVPLNFTSCSCYIVV